MQDPLTIIAIVVLTIAVTTALAVFGIRKKRLRRTVTINVLPEADSPRTTKDVATSIPLGNSSDSPRGITDQAKPNESLEQVPTGTDMVVSTTSPADSSKPDSIPIGPEEERKKLTTPSADLNTPEPSINHSAEATEISPAGGTQQEEEIIDVFPEGKQRITHEPTSTQKQRKLAPENRGGARRGKRTKEVQETRPEKTERLRKPELICWQQSRKWFLGIELLQDFEDTSQVEVTQNNVALKMERASRWPISTLFGSVRIESSLDFEPFEVPLAEPDNPFFLFKLSGQNLGSGRRIRFATRGTYLVVVPDNWIRNEALSGVAQVPADRCHLVGFSAHFFHIDPADQNRIAFIAPGDKLIEIPSGKSQFELVGLKIDDASDDLGPLFALAPPHIRSIDAAGWKNVQTIVIGEEGENRSGWRTSLDADTEAESIDLTPYLADKDGGWFFLRIYDATDGPPIESLDFRFLKSLRAINIGDHNPLPMETGHQPVTVIIKWSDHERGKLLPRHSKPIPTTVEGSTTKIEIPPEPDADNTEWILESPVNARVEIVLQMERVWWTVCKSKTPSEALTWHDKPTLLSRHYCTATSDHQLRIRFPWRRWTKEVRVGFEKGRARTYRVLVTQQIVEIPLNHFEGVSQLEDFTRDHPLRLWLDGFSEQTIAILPVQSQTDRRVSKYRDNPPIRLNLRRLFKYLNKLDRAARDTSLSELLNECRQNWRSPGVRTRRDAHLLQTACVIIVSWRVIRTKGKKPIGRRKGWIRAIVKLAETSPHSLLTTSERYEKLSHGTNDASSD